MGLEQQGWGPVGLNRAAHFRALQLEWVKLTPDDKDVSIEQRTSARCNGQLLSYSSLVGSSVSIEQRTSARCNCPGSSPPRGVLAEVSIEQRTSARCNSPLRGLWPATG